MSAVDKELSPLRGTSSPYDSDESFRDQENGNDSGIPGQVEGRCHTKREYGPPPGLLSESPISLLEEANRRLMEQRDADSELQLPAKPAAHPTIQLHDFNLQTVARQMEQLAAGEASDRLILPALGKPKQRVVDFIANLYNLELRVLPAIQPGSQFIGSPTKAYFVTQNTAPLTYFGRVRLEEILADYIRTKPASTKAKKKRKAAKLALEIEAREKNKSRTKMRLEREAKKEAEKRVREELLEEEERKKERRRQKKRRKEALALASAAGGVGNAVGAGGMAAVLPAAPAWDRNEEAKDRLADGMQQPCQDDHRGSQTVVGMGWQDAQDTGARQQGMLPFTLTRRKRFAGLGAE